MLNGPGEGVDELGVVGQEVIVNLLVVGLPHEDQVGGRVPRAGAVRFVSLTQKSEGVGPKQPVLLPPWLGRLFQDRHALEESLVGKDAKLLPSALG